MKALDCHPDKHPDDLMAGKLQIKQTKFQLRWLHGLYAGTDSGREALQTPALAQVWAVWSIQPET